MPEEDQDDEASTSGRLVPYLLMAMMMLLVLIMTGGISFYYYYYYYKMTSKRGVDTTAAILCIARNEPDWKILPKALEAYELENHRALEILSIAMETLRGESSTITNILQDKMDRLADLFRDDMAILQTILSPFPVRFLMESLLRDDVKGMARTTTAADSSNATTRYFTFPASNNYTMPSSSYESVRHVMAHLVRDWSSIGASIRTPLYTWCRRAVYQHVRSNHAILIPGAGVGRLAWDIAAHGYRVEALESSVTMAAAAYAMYHCTTSQYYELHPFAADPFINEVNSQLRYTSCFVPDIATNGRIGSHLLYSLANFDETFVPKAQYAAVITCFFLDTATTLIDYTSTIQSALIPGGVWINVGPLQWHHNSRVPLAADELKLFLSNDFQILQWFVDDTILNYRDGRSHASSSPVSTFADGYRPLRFVVRWSPNAA